MNDPLPVSLSIILIFLFVFMNGFFVAAEFALVKIRGSRMDALVSEGYLRANLASHMNGHLDTYLSACKLGITLASLGLGVIGAPVITRLIEPVFGYIGVQYGLFIHMVAFIAAFIMMTIIHIVLGELAPKTLAIRKAETITVLTALPLVYFHKLMYPVIWMLNGAANLLLQKLGIEPVTEKDSAHTEDEIRILMKQSHKNGYIDNTELTLVDNIFEFTETNAREIMIPRTEMICLNTSHTLEDNKKLALEQMLTRYPVCENDKDNIIGFVHIKDLLKDTTQSLRDIRQIMRPMTTVPESMQISLLLKLMQKRKSQIAILIDEYGGTSGLVTLEDIMEEIVGEIQDEFDEEREQLEKQNDSSYSVSGLMLIEEVNSFFDLDIETDDYDTIGGWMYSKLELPPVQSQSFRYDERCEFTIEETDHLRISRLNVRMLGQKQVGHDKRQRG